MQSCKTDSSGTEMLMAQRLVLSCWCSFVLTQMTSLNACTLRCRHRVSRSRDQVTWLGRRTDQSPTVRSIADVLNSDSVLQFSHPSFRTNIRSVHSSRPGNIQSVLASHGMCSGRSNMPDDSLHDWMTLIWNTALISQLKRYDFHNLLHRNVYSEWKLT